MKEIIQLDSHTINKIAAGEVVERPLSVVKELVENAIDAKASAITIEIKDGGTTYIRITDNGEGINRSQVQNAFKRHATSKIKTIEDLISVSSLGFRGEALSSIASVSKVELLTKTKNEFVGTRYVIEGGKELKLDDAGVPDGTTIIIRDLFYNTPARRKFLKSSKTEASYIIELIERIILSNTDISFKLIVNGQTKLQFVGDGSVYNAIYSIYGKEVANNLIRIEADNGDFLLSGYIGKPELSRGNKNYEVYFVNNRYIKSSLISRALDEAYKKYLMLHKFPMVFLNIDMPGFMIDINVHPSKKEVRFIEGDYLFTFLVNTISEKLNNIELIPSVIDTYDDNENDKTIKKEDVIPEPFEVNRISLTGAVNTNPVKSIVPKKPEIKEIDTISQIMTSEVKNRDFSYINESIKEETPVQLSLFDDIFLSEKALKKHKIIGQLFNTYWLVEYDNNLYILDQHAAHEKIKYERLIKQIRNKEVVSQIINPPVIVTLSSSEEELLSKYYDNFSALGFNVENFGGKEYSITEVPLELFGSDPKEYFLDMLDEINNGKIPKETDSINLHIATMACKSAVKGNMKMTYEEADQLISELLSLDNPYNCPHGRPTIVSYSKYDIERMFKRIVN